MGNRSLLEEDFLSKIRNIADILYNYFEDQNFLFKGKAGFILFLINFSMLVKESKYVNKLENFIIEIFDIINKGFSNPTFANGISGFGWLIEFLEQNGFIEINTNRTIGKLDEYLYHMMIRKIRNGNFDYLHGAGGIALYFLKRMKKFPKAKEFLFEYIDVLDEISIREENGKRKWISDINTKYNNTERVYNLSMSHGIASIISILSKMYAQDINKNKSEEMLIEAVHYFLSQQHDIKEYTSYSQNKVSLENHQSENSFLAW